uniref:Uncharacterized protein LOC114328163 n=1 Tax=Diabrotica virgifera virgifera TaxID=50390 RepID=A0A6P7FD63_DIAVI
YNLPEAIWSNDEYGLQVVCPGTSSAIHIAQTFGFLQLFQRISIPNSRNIFLDLMFTNDKSVEVLLGNDSILNSSLHHASYECSLRNIHKKQVDDSLFCQDLYYDFNNANYVGLNNFLAGINWEQCLSRLDLDLAVDYFYEILAVGIASFVPVKKYQTSTYPRWFSRELRQLISQKRRAHYTYTQSRSQADLNIFTRLRSECKKVREVCWSQYISLMDIEFKSNPRYFWRYIKDLKTNHSLPQTIIYGEDKANDGQEIVDLFKKKKLESTAQYIYQALFLEGQSSDVTLCALGEEFHLHKVYLYQSPYFASMFGGSWLETNQKYVTIDIVDPSITVDSMKVVLGSLYNCDIILNPLEIVPILATATMLQLDGLIEKCTEVMLETINPKIRKQWNNLILRDNCHPAKASLLVLFQIPMWISLSVSLRNLVYMLPYQDINAQVTFAELSIGGLGFIPNLTEVDASWILPVGLGIINLAIIELQGLSKINEPNKIQKFLVNIFRGISLIMIPVAASVPSCLVLYWTTSSAYGLIQNIVLLSPRVKRICRIPKTEIELENPYKHISQQLQKKFNFAFENK